MKVYNFDRRNAFFDSWFNPGVQSHGDYFERLSRFTKYEWRFELWKDPLRMELFITAHWISGNERYDFVFAPTEFSFDYGKDAVMLMKWVEFKKFALKYSRRF